MIRKTGVVRNENGIHCRPATMISKIARDYSGSIAIVNGNGVEANPSSVLSILRLGLIVGDEFTVCVSGPDEERICGDVMYILEGNLE